MSEAVAYVSVVLIMCASIGLFVGTGVGLILINNWWLDLAKKSQYHTKVSA